ncbi:MAG: ABC transporter permease [Cyclobacteriaceae bacterium]|nr:ABC transporter permease [Cyclobacteriaceae bacterium]
MKETSTPPQLPLRFFRWYCHPKLQDYIEGDLMEVYERRLSKSGKRKADLFFVVDVLLLCKPGIIKPIEGYKQLNNYGMFKSYFTIGWRNLLKQKIYSFIKIGGFALGIAACLLIALFINDELSYDQNYPKGNRIYRVLGVFTDKGQTLREVYFQAPFAQSLLDDYPEIEAAGRLNSAELFGAGSKEFRPADKPDNSYDDGFTYVDPQLLEILDIPMVYGLASKALDAPNTIVLSKRKADKYFPNENPIGKLVILSNDEKNPLTVGGVMEDFPSNTHFQFDFLITMKDREFWPGEQTSWCCSNYQTYLLLKEGADAKELGAKASKSTIEKYLLPRMIEDGVPNAKELLENANAHLEFQPVSHIHLDGDIRDGRSHGDWNTVWLFGGIAVFILIIAGINFINLSTARSANRAKEVGMRKVVGSFRSNLVSQFLTESILLSILSFVLGIMLALALLPLFNDLAGKSLTIPWSDWRLIPIFTSAAILIGFFAGLYPSFYLSKFKPIEVIKGRLALGSKSSYTQSTLVVFQFTISIVLIVSTFVTYRQMDFILNKKIGFEKDQVLLIQGASTLGGTLQTFKEELLQLPQVKSVSVSDYLPVRGTKRNGNTFHNEGKRGADRGVGGQNWVVDEDYIHTMGMTITEGRDFNARLSSDLSAAIVNQAMIKELGLTDPIGKIIDNGDKYTIIGVVEDFHFETMRENIKPLMMRLGTSPDIISVKIKSADMQEAVQSISKTWKEFVPNQPVRFAFLDESYAQMYKDVERTGRIFTSFSVLAIVVACLGLFALSAFMAEQRSKEISIRLVLGASLKNIFGLLTFNFVKLVLIAFVIAAPLAWYVMTKWLQNYAYKTEISWDVFLLTGVLSVVIALLTISYQSVRAALVNPVKNLRSE